MVKRVLLDENGLKISEPGYDVSTAGDFNLLFSSKFKAPQLILKGSFTTTATTNGIEAVTTISYGATYSPPPYVVAVANAPSWHTGLGGTAFTYLNSQWHTFIIEWPSGGQNWIYTGAVHQRGVDIAQTFATAKFTKRIFNDHVDFAFNGCESGITVKYAILDIG